MEVVKALLAAGADVNIIDGRHGGTALHWAAGSGRAKVGKILLAIEGIDVSAVDKYGDTSLHRAAEHGSAELVKTLLEKGAEIDATGNDGTPLHYAVLCSCVDVMKILLAAGADISLKNSDGRAPIGLSEGYIKQLLKDAVNELYRMRNQTIGNTGISFYEFLQADKVKLVSYACNDKLYEKLKEGRYKKAYPVYTSMIEDQYKIIERKRLEKKALEPLGCFGTFDERRQVKETWEVLNEHICESIITYLTNTDLENVINSRKEKKISFLSRLSKWLG